jgi:hypothetical protein
MRHGLDRGRGAWGGGQVEESTESAKKSLQQYISADRDLGTRMNLDAIGLSEDDAAGLEALKDISKKQVRVLPGGI